jgi:hypothetical protein
MGLPLPRLTVAQRLRLLWGKVRRLYLGVFRRGYVRRSVERRHGDCARCGACCALGYRCLSLCDGEAGAECRVHRLRPMNCRLFPIDERDLADRDLIQPDVPCGYHFDGRAADEPGHTRSPSCQSPTTRAPATSPSRHPS